MDMHLSHLFSSIYRKVRAENLLKAGGWGFLSSLSSFDGDHNKIFLYRDKLVSYIILKQFCNLHFVSAELRFKCSISALFNWKFASNYASPFASFCSFITNTNEMISSKNAWKPMQQKNEMKIKYFKCFKNVCYLKTF